MSDRVQCSLSRYEIGLAFHTDGSSCITSGDPAKLISRARSADTLCMPPMPTRYRLLALIAGAVWGVIGLAIARQMLGASVWAGVVVAPLIGLAIAILFRGFRSRPPAMRISLSLVSLYLAAGLFALATGIADAARPIPNRIPHAVVIQTVMGVWWGITFTGYLPLLWLLAYLTNSLLGRADAPGGPAPTHVVEH